MGWALGLVGILVTVSMSPRAQEPTVEVVHWSNGHLLRTGSGLRLLEQMADEFNGDNHRTDAGQRIQVRVLYNGSWEQAADLLTRVQGGTPAQRDMPNPTIVTPSASHWLTTVNHAAGRTVVDIGAAQGIALTYIGIVTYRDMAECLGWPNREIGYADIIALREDPQGWGSYSCARAEWGQRPLVAYTDPTTSDTGRSVLLSLYAIAADSSPEQLSVDDVTKPEVVGYLKRFQNLIDHYLIATRVLNSKVHQGPRFGHFFLMPEDNLIHLYEGTEQWFDPATGKKGTAPPITRPMVMIYPKEGSMARDNCACIVQAPWVTPEHVQAAEQWIAYLREDEQQESLMAAGFRPAARLPVGEPISGRFGLDPTKPGKVIYPERIDPDVAAAIDRSWEDVKHQSIVTFVIDTSASMRGDKLAQAKSGLIRALDNMAQKNQVGFVDFGDTVKTRIPVASLPQNRFAIAGAVERLQATGGTALFDGIRTGIEMADAAASDDPNAIRATVILTDGLANQGSTHLDHLIRMTSRSEVGIQRFSGFQDERSAVDATGGAVQKRDLIGAGLALQTRHPVQVFFIGIGDDADLQVGRMLAEATNAEFQGVAEKDIAEVLEEFSKYF
jgi:Ca-activated chloride channel family protein